jgi:hypothetical protein
MSEKRPYSKKELEETATHIVVGKVQTIYSRTARDGNYEYVHKGAEVKIEKLEKGKGPAGLVYVRLGNEGTESQVFAAGRQCLRWIHLQGEPRWWL